MFRVLLLERCVLAAQSMYVEPSSVLTLHPFTGEYQMWSRLPGKPQPSIRVRAGVRVKIEKPYFFVRVGGSVRVQL